MLQKILQFALVFMVTSAGAIYFSQRHFFYPASQEKLTIPPLGYRFVETSTSDKLELRAAYRPAADRKPTLLFFHGNGDSIAGAAKATERLTDAGYGALLVEYRGYGGNPGSPSESGFYKDGEAAVAWLRRHGIDPTRLIIVGNSIGSGPATEMAVRHRPAALILVSAFASLPFAVSDLYPFIPAKWVVRDRYDNEAKIGRVKNPILLLHGDADALVRLQNAQRLADANPAAKLIVIQGAGHELAYTAAAQETVLRWLEPILTLDSKAERRDETLQTPVTRLQ